MEIEYLKELRDNPIKKRGSVSKTIKPIPLTEIKQLEQVYNNGKHFPKALRELLYLAGENCYVLDKGMNDSQQEMQEYVRNKMVKYGRVINRPFYAIDVYNGSEQFLFVYLDDGNNPMVYEGHYFDIDQLPHWITFVSDSLSDYISECIDDVKNGRNPF